MQGHADEHLGWDELDAAVSRLEDHLATLPYDRALPELDAILAGAGVPRQVLTQDERARKVLHEAILARPLHEVAQVEQRRVEVELLTLEVSVLTQTLRAARDVELDDERREDVSRAARRLGWIRGRLEELRREL